MDAALLMQAGRAETELPTAPPALALGRVRRAAPWITLLGRRMKRSEKGGSSRADGIRVPKVEE